MPGKNTIDIYTCPYNKDCEIEVYPDGKRKHKIDHPVMGDVMVDEKVWRTEDGYLIVYMSDILFDGLYLWMSNISRNQGFPTDPNSKKYKILRDTPEKIEYRRSVLKSQYEKSKELKESRNNDVSAGDSSLN